MARAKVECAYSTLVLYSTLVNGFLFEFLVDLRHESAPGAPRRKIEVGMCRKDLYKQGFSVSRKKDGFKGVKFALKKSCIRP